MAADLCWIFPVPPLSYHDIVAAGHHTQSPIAAHGRNSNSLIESPRLGADVPNDMRRCSCAACIMVGLTLSITTILLLQLTLSAAPRGAHSFAAVDPAALLSSRILQRLLPSYLERDLEVLRRVCSANVTRFDIAGRELLVRNFTLRSDKQHGGDAAATAAASSSSPPAVQVGYLNVSWDSYLRPCLDVELADVDVSVDFTNVLLTRTNWHELKDKGFPPPLLTGYYDYDDNGKQAEYAAEKAKDKSTDVPEPPEEDESSKKSARAADRYLDYLIQEGGLDAADEEEEDVDTSSFAYTFLRIGRVVFRGNITLRTTSRPLGGKDLAQPFHFDLEALSDLTAQLERAADEEEAKEGPTRVKRKGCTMETAYDIVTTFFLRKLEQVLAQTVFDISVFGRESAPMQTANSLLASAGSLAKDYASSVGQIAEERARDRLGGMQQKVLDKLQAMGVGDDKVETIRKNSNSVAESAVGLVTAALRDRLNRQKARKVQTDAQDKPNGRPDGEL